MKQNKGKGLYKQLKENPVKPIKYTKEFLMKTFEDVFKNRNEDLDRKVDLPLEWKHYEWEENGERFSCWKLLAGGMFCVLTTGDKGKEEFDRIMKEEFDKQLKNK